MKPLLALQWQWHFVLLVESEVPSMPFCSSQASSALLEKLRPFARSFPPWRTVARTGGSKREAIPNLTASLVRRSSPLTRLHEKKFCKLATFERRGNGRRRRLYRAEEKSLCAVGSLSLTVVLRQSMPATLQCKQKLATSY